MAWCQKRSLSRLATVFSCEAVCEDHVLRCRVGWGQRRSLWPFMLPRYLWTTSCGQRWLRQSGEHAAVPLGTPNALLMHGGGPFLAYAGLAGCKFLWCLSCAAVSATAQGVFLMALTSRGHDRPSQSCLAGPMPNSHAQDAAWHHYLFLCPESSVY